MFYVKWGLHLIIICIDLVFCEFDVILTVHRL